MAHEKFLDLMEDSRLFFANAGRLTDEYEVTVPDSTLRQKKTQLRSEGLTGRDLAEEMARFHWESNPMKDLVLINCWSMRRHESYALWKIYLGGESNGVAVRTTVGSLRSSIEKGKDSYPEDFFVGQVDYEEHLNPDEITRFGVISTKKPFYDFEDEVRALILNYPLSEGGTRPPYNMSVGRTVKVSLPDLVHRVYVSPFSDSGYGRDVVELVKSVGLRAGQVRHSEIRDK